MPIYRHPEEFAANWHLRDDFGVLAPADVVRNLGLGIDFDHHSHYCSVDHLAGYHCCNDFHHYVVHHRTNSDHHKDFFRYTNSYHHTDYFYLHTDYSVHHTDYFGCNCRCTEKSV